MQKEVRYKLIDPPQSQYTDKNTGARLIPAGQRVIKLIDDIIEDVEENGETVQRSRTICVVKGEKSIYLDDHRDKDRSKKSIETLVVNSKGVSIPANDVNLLWFLRLSSKSNPNGLKPQIIELVDDDKDASVRTEKHKAQANAITKVYDPANWGKVKAYVVATNLFTTTQIGQFGQNVVTANLASQIKEEKKSKYDIEAKQFLKDFDSEMLQRKYEMVLAVENGRAVVDNVTSNIVFAEGGKVICSFTGKDPYDALASYTMSSEGRKAYQYLMEGLTDSIAEVEDKLTMDDLNDCSLEDLVNKALRFGVLEKKGNSYRFDGKAVGGDSVKCVEHFSNHKEKIEGLKEQILENQP